MGQKVNPKGLGVGVIKDWNSRWFADKKDSGDYLAEDHKIHGLIKKGSFSIGTSSVSIGRVSNKIKVTVNIVKPGMITGRQSVGAEELKNKLEKLTGKELVINTEEIKFQGLDAQLVAKNIVSQLEGRISFRCAMKQTMQRSTGAGTLGTKTMVSGRLGGADMVGSERYSGGAIPLQTLRAAIDHGSVEVDTVRGKLGIKAWLYGDEMLSGMTEKDLPVYKSEENDKDKRRRNNNRKGKSQAAKNQLERGKYSMLMPRRIKYRRTHRDRVKGKALKGDTLIYGGYGIQALGPCWLTANQIEAVRHVAIRYTKRGGNIWIRVFSDKSTSKKPTDTRMGSGRGAPEYWVAVIKPGRVLLEMVGISEGVAREATRLTQHKLSTKTKFIAREEFGEEDGEADEN